MRLTSFLWGHAAYHVCAVRKSLLDMEGTLQLLSIPASPQNATSTHRLACETLAQHSGIRANEQVGYCRIVVLAGDRRRECPASSCISMRIK